MGVSPPRLTDSLQMYTTKRNYGSIRVGVRNYESCWRIAKISRSWPDSFVWPWEVLWLVNPIGKRHVRLHMSHPHAISHSINMNRLFTLQNLAEGLEEFPLSCAPLYDKILVVFVQYMLWLFFFFYLFVPFFSRSTLVTSVVSVTLWLATPAEYRVLTNVFVSGDEPTKPIYSKSF